MLYFSGELLLLILLVLLLSPNFKYLWLGLRFP
jgi:hypothetical protein